jgi:hypothetical protein
MRFAPFLLAALLLTPVAQAQDDAGSAKVTFRVTRFDPSDRPPPSFQVGGAGARTELEVPLTYIGGPFKATLRDGKYLDFFEGAAEKPSLTVDVPPAMRKDLLLIFIPKEESYNILKVHAPATKINGGDRYIVNATAGDLAIQLGKTKPILITPAKASILKNPGGNKIETHPVVIKQKKKGEKEWNLVSTENWACDPRFRNFLFIYRSPRTGHIAFHGVSDRLPGSQ